MYWSITRGNNLELRLNLFWQKAGTTRVDVQTASDDS